MKIYDSLNREKGIQQITTWILDNKKVMDNYQEL